MKKNNLGILLTLLQVLMVLCLLGNIRSEAFFNLTRYAFVGLTSFVTVFLLIGVVMTSLALKNLHLAKRVESEKSSTQKSGRWFALVYILLDLLLLLSLYYSVYSFTYLYYLLALKNILALVLLVLMRKLAAKVKKNSI